MSTLTQKSTKSARQEKLNNDYLCIPNQTALSTQEFVKSKTFKKLKDWNIFDLIINNNYKL
jgi:hypothetical protein